MEAKLRSFVKFFRRQQKVILVTMMEDVGILTVSAGKVTLGGNDVRVYRPTSSPKVFPPEVGDSVSLVVVVGEYTNAKGTYDVTDDDTVVPTAQLQTTITNDPPGTPPPIPYVINETETTP